MAARRSASVWVGGHGFLQIVGADLVDEAGAVVDGCRLP